MSLCTRLFMLFVLVCAVLAICPAASAASLESQTIVFFPIPDQTLDAAPFQVLAVPNSNLPVTLSVSGPATLSALRLLTLTGTGMVTITATQAGNSQFAPATAQLSFNVRPAQPVLSWTPPSLVYGMPFPASGLNASATAAPLVDLSADAATLSAQLNTSAITGSEAVTVPASSSLLRYEGSTMEPSTSSTSVGGYISDGSAPPTGIMYRVVFTCTCSQFEFALQSGQGTYRVWVDGQWTSVNSTDQLSDYPYPAFYRVQFPDRRARQIKIAVSGNPPFFGLVTATGDAISAPQVPVGERVIIFGDSWTGPTIVPPAVGPAQPGLQGSGYPQVLGEYFNWDYWDTGVAGEGFTQAGTDANGHAFPARALTDICGRSPAATLVLGGTNDGSTAESVIQQDATTMFTNLANCLPNVETWVYGPQLPDYGTAVEAALAAAAPAFSKVSYTDMAAQMWLYANPSDPFNPAAGNVYLYFNGHPTPYGHDYLAEKIAFDLLGKYPSMAPAAYTLFSPASVAGAYSYSVESGALLPAGQQNASVTFAPQNTAGYAQATLTAVVSVTKAASTTTVSAVAGQTAGAATLTANVAPQYGGVPSGQVTFSSNGGTLGTAALNASGAATFAATGLANGQDTISAAYAGDGNFNPSSGSGSLSISNIVTPGFSFNLNQSQLTIAPGQTGAVMVSVTPVGGFTAQLAVSCTGLPAGASCGFATGGNLSVAGSPTTAQLTISSPSATAGVSKGAGGGLATAIELSGLFGAGLLLLPGVRSSRRTLRLLVPCLLLVLVMLPGCGATSPSSSAPPVTGGTYTVQVILVSTANPAISQTQTLTLVIS